MGAVTLGPKAQSFGKFPFQTSASVSDWGDLLKGVSGDLVLDVTANETKAATAEAWTKTINIALKTAAGGLHKWYNGPITLAVTNTSSAGTASITPAAGSHNMTDGELSVVMAGDEADWLGGTAQQESIQVTGACSTAGDLTVAVTAAGMTGSPKSVTVAVTTDDDSAAKVAAKIVAGLAADTTVAGFFTVTQGTGENTDLVILTAKTKAANDATMAIAVTAGETGVTVGSSTNATAGVAPETATLTVSAPDQDSSGDTDASILGWAVASKTCVVTFA